MIYLHVGEVKCSKHTGSFVSSILSSLSPRGRCLYQGPHQGHGLKQEPWEVSFQEGILHADKGKLPEYGDTEGAGHAEALPRCLVILQGLKQQHRQQEFCVWGITFSFKQLFVK